jgi:polyisoprenoid-binding protein YceI
MPRSRIAFLIAALMLNPLSSAKAAVEAYDIDPVHTLVGFSAATTHVQT